METCGLVSLEAALAGVPLVGSTFGHELEYLEETLGMQTQETPTACRKRSLEAWEGRAPSPTSNRNETQSA